MSLIESLKNNAKNTFKSLTKNDEFLPKAFLIKDGKIHMEVPLDFSEEDRKKKSFNLLGTICAENGCHSVAFFMDSWIREFDKSVDKDYISNNWETECPSTYPESMRKQAILICLFDFKNEDQNCLIVYNNSDSGFTIEREEYMDYAEGSIREAVMMGFVYYKGHELFKNNESLEGVQEKLIDEYPNLILRGEDNA